MDFLLSRATFYSFFSRSAKRLVKSRIFFPDNGQGAANAAGFGWRNGG
jgi:hypothetical protein